MSGSLDEGRRGVCRLFQRQLQLFDRMEVDGIMPVKRTYHILIQSAKQANNLQMAEYFFHQYRNTGSEPTVRTPLSVGPATLPACIPLSGPMLGVLGLRGHLTPAVGVVCTDSSIGRLAFAHCLSSLLRLHG